MRYNHFSMLPEAAFKSRFGSSSPATLEGGSSGKPAPVTPEANPGFSYDPTRFTPQTNIQASIDRGPSFPAYTPDYSKAQYSLGQQGISALDQPFNYGDLGEVNGDAVALSILGSLISGYNAPSSQGSSAQGGSNGIAGLSASE